MWEEAVMNTCCVCGCTKYMGIKPGLHFQLPSEDRNSKWNTTNRAEGELAAYKLSKVLVGSTLRLVSWALVFTGQLKLVCIDILLYLYDTEYTCTSLGEPEDHQ